MRWRDFIYRVMLKTFILSVFVLIIYVGYYVYEDIRIKRINKWDKKVMSEIKVTSSTRSVKIDSIKDTLKVSR